MKKSTWQFPPLQKSYRHEWEYLLSFCSHVAQKQKHWEGKNVMWIHGQDGKNFWESSPQASSVIHRKGRILVFGDFVIFPPDGCNAHMEVSELSFLKSLRKLILLILMRDVAHSDQDLGLGSFSAGYLNIPPKRTTLLHAQALTRLAAAHIWKYPKESNQILPFVQAGSGCIEILSEISVLGLLIQPSWADGPRELSTTAPTKTETHPTTPQRSRGKNVFIFTKS